MYLHGLCFACTEKTSLHGLAQGIDWLSMGASLLTATKGGGGSSMPSNVVETSTNVNTQVNPQISPVFVQQEHPSNSPVSATVGQGLPGNVPGVDYSQLSPLNESQVKNLTPYALAAAGILGLAVILKKRR